MSAGDDRNAPLEPPTFELPSGDDNYELWTVRLPSSLDIQSLQGVELDLNTPSSMATFESSNDDTRSYSLSQGAATENEQFRLLLRDNNDDDSDSDEDDNHNFMRPLARPFDRHVNTCLAGETANANTLSAASSIRRQSYAHVPQVTGLKRRWMPPGACTKTTPTITNDSVARKGEPSNDLSSDDNVNKSKESLSHKKQKATPIGNKAKLKTTGEDDRPSTKTQDVHMNGVPPPSIEEKKKKSSKKKHKKEHKKHKKKKKSRHS